MRDVFISKNFSKFVFMPAGVRTLFQEIFMPETAIPDKQRKGRSSTLIEKRNECLLDRYYWHGRKQIDGKRIDYSSLLETVSNEFFLSMVTIPDIVDANYTYLTTLKSDWPIWDRQKEEKMRKHFQLKWPHLVW